MTGPNPGDWAQGSLRLLPAAMVLEMLAKREFTGRFALVSAATPRRVVTVHMERGRPVLVAGSGVPPGLPVAEESARARQVLVEALGWTVGSFRAEVLATALTEGERHHEIGEIDELITSAEERSRMWPRLAARLPTSYEAAFAARGPVTLESDDPVQQAILAALDRPRALRSLAAICGIDDHVLLRAALDLEHAGALRLGTESHLKTPADPELSRIVSDFLAFVRTDEAMPRALKITVLSWDAATCFRAVEALMGRHGEPPGDVESQTRFHILHELRSLSGGDSVEVLAFRADAFEPAFVGALVQDCHLFLLVSDADAGHLSSEDRPLVERVNELRGMFRGASAAGRVTVGGGAVTDPGTDSMIPELTRYVSWSELAGDRLLPAVLREVGRLLGIDLDEP